MSVTKTPATLDDLRRVWIGRNVRGSGDANHDTDRQVKNIEFNAQGGDYIATSEGGAGSEQISAKSPADLHRRLCGLAAPSA